MRNLENTKTHTSTLPRPKSLLTGINWHGETLEERKQFKQREWGKFKRFFKENPTGIKHKHHRESHSGLLISIAKTTLYKTRLDILNQQQKDIKEKEQSDNSTSTYTVTTDHQQSEQLSQGEFAKSDINFNLPIRSTESHSCLKLGNKLLALNAGNLLNSDDTLENKPTLAEDENGKLYVVKRLKILDFDEDFVDKFSQLKKEALIASDMEIAIPYSAQKASEIHFPSSNNGTTTTETSTKYSGYIAYEYKGQALTSYLKENMLTEDQQYELAIQIFLAIHRMHTGDASKSEVQRAHLDIKLANMTIDENGEVHLIDFGLTDEKPDNRLSSRQDATSRGYKPKNMLELSKRQIDIFTGLKCLFGDSEKGEDSVINQFVFNGINITQESHPELFKLKELISDDQLAMSKTDLKADDILVDLIIARSKGKVKLTEAQSTILHSSPLAKEIVIQQYQLDNTKCDIFLFKNESELASKAATYITDKLSRKYQNHSHHASCKVESYIQNDCPNLLSLNESKIQLGFANHLIEQALNKAKKNTSNLNKKMLISKLITLSKQIAIGSDKVQANDVNDVKKLLKQTVRILSHNRGAFDFRALKSLTGEATSFKAVKSELEDIRKILGIGDSEWKTYFSSNVDTYKSGDDNIFTYKEATNNFGLMEYRPLFKKPTPLLYRPQLHFLNLNNESTAKSIEATP